MFTPLYILFQLFQANSATLSGAAEETLERTALFITENSGCQIYKQPVVAGHGTLCGRPIGII